MAASIDALTRDLQAFAADKTMPGGEGSLAALSRAMGALSDAQRARDPKGRASAVTRARRALTSFQSDARRSVDFTFDEGRGSGDQAFSDFIARLDGL